jgi:uncharacterized protein YdhG (YjbR/CyaY superfamily)
MKKFASVAAYLRAVPPAPRAALQQLRKTIKAAAPEATEVISYGIPGYKHHGFTVDKPLPAALVRKLVKARIAENERKR